MISFFDRQKQRLERLSASIVAADDRTLAHALARATAAEVAAALRLLPLERANFLLEGVTQTVLAEALVLSEADGGPDPEAAERLALDLQRALPEAPEIDPRAAATGTSLEMNEITTPPSGAPGPTGDAPPLSVRALDLAGRVLGTFSIAGKS
jgi:hypothetical protein